MAETKKTETTTAGANAGTSAGTAVGAKTSPTTSAEAAYTVNEFAANAEKLFGQNANSDLVYAAFKVNGKSKATLSDAKDIVGKFMNKEVK